MQDEILNLANKVRNWAGAEDAAEQLERSRQTTVTQDHLNGLFIGSSKVKKRQQTLYNQNNRSHP